MQGNVLLGKSNDFYMSGTIAEDQMKINVVRVESTERLEASMYKEAAKRVVFKNCMGVCELTNETLPNFNRNFYYNQPDA